MTFFSAKNKQSILEPNFTKSEQKARFGQFNKIILSISPKSQFLQAQFLFKLGSYS